MPATVSILIPCHNAVQWLVAAIESALAQTWPKCEIILVDDGSSDNSLAIARSFEPRGVTVLSQPNRGASAARNTALRAARGEYIQFLDADDLLAPDKIEKQVQRLVDASPDAVASGPWARFKFDPAEAQFIPERVWADFGPVDWLVTSWSGGGMMHPAAWLVPSSLIERAGPWNETLSLNDDGEYFTRVVLESSAVVFCAESRSYYRTGHALTLSRRRSRLAWESACRALELCEDHLRMTEDTTRTRRACALRYQDLAYAAYPQAADIAQHSESRVADLGGCELPFPGGRAAQRLACLAGWRFARRLQYWYRRMIYHI